MGYSIAIDGPAGAGKSTIARRIAKSLSFVYVDTGAMYRAIALHLIRQGVWPGDSDQIGKVCQEADITIRYQDSEQQVLLNGENVNGLIRTEEVGNMASASSVNPKVRLKLVELQRALAAGADVVMDGRDIGTYVLPDAFVKIYLTASVKTRANRRYLELQKKGMECDLAQITEDIEERDHRDMTRDFAPLRQAKDAVLVDTSSMNIEEVVDQILKLYKEKRAKL
ncbi:(d)CMP kinase [Diplocloster modestus]|uniref:Cytidylate kinase n=1 Tax=Diplocloster modestus TaxID=2850322 RepID=A0ABS6K8V1_9FIRM|nr:(d)CMP kinase [Diplocloster modestus]MBU9726940.1 (d)CMP kinase [Diplocloster modestus]